jgi:hypothetical protein
MKTGHSLLLTFVISALFLVIGFCLGALQASCSESIPITPDPPKNVCEDACVFEQLEELYEKKGWGFEMGSFVASEKYRCWMSREEGEADVRFTEYGNSLNDTFLKCIEKAKRFDAQHSGEDQ